MSLAPSQTGPAVPEARGSSRLAYKLWSLRDQWLLGAATSPAVLASSPHASCHGTDCVLSADSDSTLQADLWSEVERGAGGLHTPRAREESPWSLLDCCWLLAFRDLPLIYPQIKSELSVFLCQRECFPTPGTSAVFLAQTVTAYFVS